MRENATNRLRGCDPAADGRAAFSLAGRNRAALDELRPAGSVEAGLSHFLSEMSCGEVVARTVLFPGRVFEFSSLTFIPVSTPLRVLHCGRFATWWRQKTVNGLRNTVVQFST